MGVGVGFDLGLETFVVHIDPLMAGMSEADEQTPIVDQNGIDQWHELSSRGEVTAASLGRLIRRSKKGNPPPNPHTKRGQALGRPGNRPSLARPYLDSPSSITIYESQRCVSVQKDSIWSYPPPTLYRLQPSTLLSARFAPSSYVHCQEWSLLTNKAWSLGDSHAPVFLSSNSQSCPRICRRSQTRCSHCLHSSCDRPNCQAAPHRPVLCHALEHSMEKVLKIRSSTAFIARPHPGSCTGYLQQAEAVRLQGTPLN